MDLRLRIGFLDPDALLLWGMKDFCTADGTGDGNAAAHLVATHWHTRSHSPSHRHGNAKTASSSSRFVAASIGKSRRIVANKALPSPPVQVPDFRLIPGYFGLFRRQ
jgi:hypothetical protein